MRRLALPESCYALLLLLCPAIICQAAEPKFEFEHAKHTIGQFGLAVSNYGIMGANATTDASLDVFTGQTITIGSDFPIGSGLRLLSVAQYWVGGIIGEDTLVSTFPEWLPLTVPNGAMRCRSTLTSSDWFDSTAVSQQDVLAKLTDSFTVLRLPREFNDEPGGRQHVPLIIELEQTSYAWSMGYSEDIVLFDLRIRNVGHDEIRNMYFGLNVIPNLTHMNNTGAIDDLSGYLETATLPDLPEVRFPVRTVWSVDNDGDPVNGSYFDGANPYRSQRNALGVAMLGSPVEISDENVNICFNWWKWLAPSDPSYLDYGPQRWDSYRDFGAGNLGTPRGDAARYHILSNGERDYPTVFAASVPDPVSWVLPSSEAAQLIATGTIHEYVLSIGPFDLPPGTAAPVAFAFVGGENAHRDPANFGNLPDDPARYYDNLDFSDLEKNVIWANWIYDTPGVDTDEDGYFGEYFVSGNDSGSGRTATPDTTWYRGDGVPDWKAAAPPPAPVFWITPVENGAQIRFNGTRSETEPDILSQTIDFEGYHVYLGRDPRPGSMALVASYDREDYDKWVFRQDIDTAGIWQIEPIPFSRDSLRCLYSRAPDPCLDSAFDPLAYTSHSPYRHRGFTDSVFYFSIHDQNTSEFGATTPIKKVYPEVPPPSSYPDNSIPPEDYTEEGLLKYYEYEFSVTNLLMTVPYWINVTAFDFGSPRGRLEALETSRTLGAKKFFPSGAGLSSANSDLNVYVYPNPYRIDGGYRSSGFEGRTEEDRPDNRVREIHFANLPAKCTIGIYTLDGDLVREIYHDIPESDPNHTHDSWDIITRNAQEPVSGLYYWVVQAADGRAQIGKLVLIM